MAMVLPIVALRMNVAVAQMTAISGTNANFITCARLVQWENSWIPGLLLSRTYYYRWRRKTEGRGGSLGPAAGTLEASSKGGSLHNSKWQRDADALVQQAAVLLADVDELRSAKEDISHQSAQKLEEEQTMMYDGDFAFLLPVTMVSKEQKERPMCRLHDMGMQRLAPAAMDFSRRAPILFRPAPQASKHPPSFSGSLPSLQLVQKIVLWVHLLQSQLVSHLTFRL